MKKELQFLSVVTWMVVKSVHHVCRKVRITMLTLAITVNINGLHGLYSMNLWFVSAEEWHQIRR
jgi:hypothetical protein